MAASTSNGVNNINLQDLTDISLYHDHIDQGPLSCQNRSVPVADPAILSDERGCTDQDDELSARLPSKTTQSEPASVLRISPASTISPSTKLDTVKDNEPRLIDKDLQSVQPASVLRNSQPPPTSPSTELDSIKVLGLDDVYSAFKLHVEAAAKDLVGREKGTFYQKSDKTCQARILKKEKLHSENCSHPVCDEKVVKDGKWRPTQYCTVHTLTHKEFYGHYKSLKENLVVTDIILRLHFTRMFYYHTSDKSHAHYVIDKKFIHLMEEKLTHKLVQEIWQGLSFKGLPFAQRKQCLDELVKLLKSFEKGSDLQPFQSKYLLKFFTGLLDSEERKIKQTRAAQKLFSDTREKLGYLFG